MIEYNRYSWWKTAFSFRGTALPRAGWRVMSCVLYAILIQAAFESGAYFRWYDEKHFVGIDPVGHAVVGSLLGFLIVFRMNSSNNRYWEGRSHWGQLINSSRNLVRFGCEYSEGDRELARLVSGYVITLRRSLRGHRDTEEADVYLPAPLCEQVSRFGNIPTGVASAISHWIGQRYRQGKFDSVQVRHMEDQLSKMVDSQGGCEKIQKTPLPFIYVAMIKQLVLAYLITLPLVLCERCGWWSPVLIFVVSLALLGMEEASVEIEDPFGTDENCLNLEALTLTIARDTGQLAALKPAYVCDDDS
ncbi:MAG: hypothetical protein C0478_12495 [Planctomyces sp.]|nr:hypothetical protein [Planctomyces sp.]